VSFKGFGDLLVDFYEGLAADNSKAYWTDHKPVYDEQVHAPMVALLAELEPEFGPGKVFRPYRDVRFSRDKSPYKTHCGAISGGYYVQVDADGLLIAGGCYETGSDQVDRLRTAVADERRGADLGRRLQTLRRKGFSIEGERLKRPPRGFPAEHPRAELLRHKTLYAVRRWPADDVLHGPACADRVRDGWRALRPLAQWLNDHVGASTQPRR